MDSFRWILLIAAVVIIALIYLTGRSRKTSISKYWEEQPTDGIAVDNTESRHMPTEGVSVRSGTPMQPALDEDDLQELGGIVPRDAGKPRDRQLPETAPISTVSTDGELPAVDVNATEEREMLPKAEAEQTLITLSVMATDDGQYTIKEIRRALDNEGLKFGIHKIYHRYEPAGSHQITYSISSLVEPGTLGPEDADTTKSPGVAMFLQLPGDFDPVRAYDDMVDTATRLKNELGAELCDDKRQRLSMQTMRYMRDQLIEYTHKNYIQSS